MTRLGKRTGPRPGFTRNDVVEAALELGVADFTLTAVAKRLGVAVSGLYRTISSREDLLAACLEQIAAQVDVPRSDANWPEAVRAHVESIWGMLEDYPGLAGAILNAPLAHHLFRAPVAPACQNLVDGGLSPEDAGVVLDFVGDTVISTHAQIEIMRSPVNQTGFPDPVEAPAEPGPNGRGPGPENSTGLEEASRAAATRTQRLPAALFPNESWLDRGGLDRKIEIIIRGVAAGLTTSSTGNEERPPGRQRATAGD